MGIECRTSNENLEMIPDHWARFMGENIYAQIPGKSSEEVVALYCDYAGDCTQPYSLVIGCWVESADQIPEGMVAKEVPGGKFAYFLAKGEHPKALVDTWGHVWQTELQRSYTGDYEIYGQKFFAQDPQVDLFIAID